MQRRAQVSLTGEGKSADNSVGGGADFLHGLLHTISIPPGALMQLIRQRHQ
jgi:hypothetical protein